MTTTEDARTEAAHGFPASTKVYRTGSRGDLRVPMREIEQAPTNGLSGPEPNAPVVVYDTSGPYTDPAAVTDIRRGLPRLREVHLEGLPRVTLEGTRVFPGHVRVIYST